MNKTEKALEETRTLLAFVRRELEDAKKQLSGVNAYIRYRIHPEMKKHRVYVPETGEELVNWDAYGEAYRTLVEYDKKAKSLEGTIAHIENHICDLEKEVAELELQVLRNVLKRKETDQLLENYFGLTKQKTEVTQLKIW